MPELTCVHCNKTMDPESCRRGNVVICPSCKGEMYMPQVREKTTLQKSSSQTPISQSTPRAKAPPIGAKSRNRKAAVSSSGVGITIIIIVLVVFGGAGLTAAGYVVYKSSKNRTEAQEQRRLAAAAEALAQKKAEEEVAAAKALTMPLEPSQRDLEAMKKAHIALAEASQEAQEQFQKDLARAGIHLLLTPERVAKDTDFSESRMMLKEIRKAFEFHRADSWSVLEQFIKDLDAIEYEGMPKEVFMTRVRAGHTANQSKYKEMWDLEALVLKQYEEAIHHLEKTRGKWKLEGAILAFDDVKDAEVYRQLFSEVDKLSQRQADMIQKIQNVARQSDYANGFPE